PRRRRVGAAAAERPVGLMVIDSPDFNLRLAPAVRRLGIPVIYYISPQIWAWRRGRIASIRAFAERVLVIFPFEEAIYRHAGIPVQFVGHPLIDLAKASTPRGALLRALGLAPDTKRIALLPGSRPNEVARILPRLVDSVIPLGPSVQVVVARAPNLDDRLFTEASRLKRVAIVT